MSDYFEKTNEEWLTAYYIRAMAKQATDKAKPAVEQRKRTRASPGKRAKLVVQNRIRTLKWFAQQAVKDVTEVAHDG